MIELSEADKNMIPGAFKSLRDRIDSEKYCLAYLEGLMFGMKAAGFREAMDKLEEVWKDDD